MHNVARARGMTVEHGREQSRVEEWKNWRKTIRNIETLNNGEQYEQKAKNRNEKKRRIENKNDPFVRSFVHIPRCSCQLPKCGDARRLVRKCYCNCFVIIIICWMKLVVCIGVFKIFGVMPVPCGCAIFGIGAAVEHDTAVARPPIFLPILCPSRWFSLSLLLAQSFLRNK